MRHATISVGEYYHLYNRGNDKQKIFRDSRDINRFLFLVLYFQAPIPIANIERRLVQHPMLHTLAEEVVKERYIELINFSLMPNHFHLTAKELKEGGISRYMQRVLNAYTKYFNIKYNRSGHLFQGSFQSVHVQSNEQLLRLSVYIHRNPIEISAWSNKFAEYPWSSYQDYIGNNRWGKLLKTDIITKQFADSKEYKQFTEASIPKNLNLSDNLKIDTM